MGSSPMQGSPVPGPVCPVCGPAGGYTCHWQDDSLGRPHVKATCGRCGKFLKFLPKIEIFKTMAAQARSACKDAEPTLTPPPQHAPAPPTMAEAVAGLAGDLGRAAATAKQLAHR